MVLENIYRVLGRDLILYALKFSGGIYSRTFVFILVTISQGVDAQRTGYVEFFSAK